MNDDNLELLRVLREKCHFLHTNEGLDAIIAGLEIKPTDSVLAICGSGDQAFAMLEYAKDVVAVDTDKAAIEYVILRKRLLEEGNFYCFLSKDEKRSTGYIKGINDAEYAEIVDYFTYQRLGEIRNRLVDLQFREGDIFKHLEKNPNTFSKIYLSNAIDYLKKEKDVRILNRVAGMSGLGTLIYVSTGYWLDAPIKQAALKGLEIDQRLTAIARDKEDSRKARCYDEHHSPHKWDSAILRVV
jgi:SAM-dependent methyltransferase